MTDEDRRSTGLAAALVAAMGALRDPVKDAKVSAGAKRYTYLTLPALLEEVRPVLAQHGLAAVQDFPFVAEGSVAVRTTILHASGEKLSFEPVVIRCSGAAQDVGSAITYGRRYSLTAALGLTGADDDDGAAAHAAPRAAAAPPAPPPGMTPADAVEQFEQIAEQVGRSVEQITSKWRGEHGGLSLDEFLALPVADTWPLLSALIAYVKQNGDK
jgi:hypothetical protein